MTGRPRQPRGKATSPRTIGIRQKQARAMELRAAGWSFDAIAKEVGYKDRASAHNAVTTALATVLREPADNLVEVEQQRIDRGLVEVFKILDEDYPEPQIALDLDEVSRLRLARVWVETIGERSDLKLKAVDRLIRLSETRRKLLGLDQPSKTELDLGTAPVTVVFTGALAPERAAKPDPT